MTKQQTLELLKCQLPGFYSVEQVIKMIEDIEEQKVMSNVENDNEEVIDDFLTDISNAVNRAFNYNGADYVDIDSAEFSLDGRCISLDSIELNGSEIIDYFEEKVRDIFENGKYSLILNQEKE